MARLLNTVGIRGRRSMVIMLAGTIALALAGVAIAKTLTLQIAKNAKVTNFNTGVTQHENIVVNARGRAVYTLSGDSKSHPKCTKTACLAIWPPVKVSSTKGLSKASGIKGRLGTWRHKGFIQLTLAGHPLYRYAGDGTQKHVATGEAIHSFGGTWHVVKVSSQSTGTSVPSTMPSSTPGYPGFY